MILYYYTNCAIHNIGTIPILNDVQRCNFRSQHNSARNFQENVTMVKSQLPAPTICIYCNARLFYRESHEICCCKGKVSFPQVIAPQELLHLFLDSSTEARHFRKHIRSYNHIFSFTSIGVHLDESLAATGHGIFSFRAQGGIYHNIGGFYPDQVLGHVSCNCTYMIHIMSYKIGCWRTLNFIKPLFLTYNRYSINIILLSMCFDNLHCEQMFMSVVC